MRKWLLLILLTTSLPSCVEPTPKREMPAPKTEKQKQTEREQRRKTNEAYRSMKISDMADRKKERKQTQDSTQKEHDPIERYPKQPNKN